MDYQSQQDNLDRPRVALPYDERMCQHCNANGEDHRQIPERIKAIWKKLESRGIPQRCVVLNAKEAKDIYIRSVHDQSHIKLIRNSSSKCYDSQRRRVALSFNSIHFNDGSSESACLAAGSVIEPGLSSTFDSDSEDEAIDANQPLLKLKIDEDHHERKIDINNFSPHEETSLFSFEDCNELHQNVAISDNWRSIYSKINIWYGCYGSNLWIPRFLCYIEGGQVEGMQNVCSGSNDRSLPNEIKWKTVRHRLFFGRSHTSIWGKGGSAFLNPDSNLDDKAYMCIYKITLEQFNDLLRQENVDSPEIDGYCGRESPPLFDLSALDFATKNKYKHLEALKVGWYSYVVHLGTDCDLPILTMTCPLSYIESFRSGKLPMSAPADSYAATIVRGLVQGEKLSEEEAVDYIRSAAARPL